MSNLNKVVCTGRLGRDPEVRHTASGKAVTNLSIAINQKFGENERTDWPTVICWDGLAENVGKYLKKGSKIGVDGRLQTRSWEDSEGHKRYVTEIVARNVEFLDSKPQGDGDYGYSHDVDGPPEILDEDIPF